MATTNKNYDFLQLSLLSDSNHMFYTVLVPHCCQPSSAWVVLLYSYFMTILEPLTSLKQLGLGYYLFSINIHQSICIIVTGNHGSPFHI